MTIFMLASSVMPKVLNPQIVDLKERNAPVDPVRLLETFMPPPRFAGVRFSNYQPNPDFVSQQNAKERLTRFVLQETPRKGFNLFKKTEISPSLYLDGGFGVGKTHLLAATWFESKLEKVFLSFAELVYTIGALGMEKAVQAFSKYKLICLDEFELDDVGNTLMVAMFFGRLIPNGTRVVTTSNTLPNQLGEGRFNADDFKREIQSIASRFEGLKVDGPDYRHREGLSAPHPLTDTQLETQFQAFDGIKTLASFNELNAHLEQLHPIRYVGLLEGLEGVFIKGLSPIKKQDDALRFVHFVDKLYDREIRFAASGCEIAELFLESYKHGGYAKKYARCVSRLGELLRDSTPS
jgi:cell division protein ZapE